MDHELTKIFLEEKAAMAFHKAYDRRGESGDNVAHVANHNLLIGILKRFGVSLEGLINGYIRAYNQRPYFSNAEESAE